MERRVKKKKPGRKPIKRKFDETRLGYLLKMEAPTEYNLIIELNRTAPDADLIEYVSYSSTNTFFRKAKFRKALIEYRKTGLYCGKPHIITPEKEKYYLKLRKKQWR